MVFVSPGWQGKKGKKKEDEVREVRHREGRKRQRNKGRKDKAIEERKWGEGGGGQIAGEKKGLMESKEGE